MAIFKDRPGTRNYTLQWVQLSVLLFSLRAALGSMPSHNAEQINAGD